ncbi:hypothetical protein [Nonomuraea sp. NPDC050643]|uniref:hypothetical protein n=1 Tax=Nonomuraea sp. NPDC050643 TaxID=3155660 RepID=UPI0033CE1E94
MLLSFWVSRFGDLVGAGRLITMRRIFEQVSAFFSDNLKLSELKVLAVLACVYLLSARAGDARRLHLVRAIRPRNRG